MLQIPERDRVVVDESYSYDMGEVPLFEQYSKHFDTKIIPMEYANLRKDCFRYHFLVPNITSCSNKTYNGSEQTACSCSGGTIGGSYKATNAGTYTASCSGDSEFKLHPLNISISKADKVVNLNNFIQNLPI